jgi:FKBP-type peptidyl-prolyl cis-trans isomerase FklB
MKRILITLFIVSFTCVACEKKPSTPPPEEKAITKAGLVTQEDKASYAMGFDMGERINKLGTNIDPDIFSKGLKDGLAETASPLMTKDEVTQAIKDFQNEIRGRQVEERKKMGAENKAKGAKFLEENKQKAGVVTLESGLQYKVLKEGTGESPKAKDKVICQYRGTTIDGKEFDSSFKRNKPATFSVNRVIKGWTEALQLMKVGAKWQLFIPPDLAYGNRGTGRGIGPEETLTFEIELLGIEDSDKPKP